MNKRNNLKRYNRILMNCFIGISVSLIMLFVNGVGPFWLGVLSVSVMLSIVCFIFIYATPIFWKYLGIVSIVLFMFVIGLIPSLLIILIFVIIKTRNTCHG
jgi:hypothetical protein